MTGFRIFLAVWALATGAAFWAKLTGGIQAPWVLVTAIVWAPIALAVLFFGLICLALTFTMPPMDPGAESGEAQDCEGQG